MSRKKSRTLLISILFLLIAAAGAGVYAVTVLSRPATDVDTFYVQPGHYLCLGDNSGQSSDGRSWGLVPERLMLGKAVFVFFPINRVGFIK